MSLDPTEFAGRVAFVTGAAGGGIGEAIARRLAAGGAAVAVTDAHAGRTAKVVESLRDCSGQVLGYPLDVGDRPRAEAVVDAVTNELGVIDILVNNAAYNVMGSIFDYDLAAWDRVLAVNLDGPMFLTQLVMQRLRAAARPGSIVNISTTAPDSGGLGLEVAYSVSKGGLNVLTRSCAHEGGPYGIRVNTVTMGVVTGTRFSDVLHPEIATETAANTPLRRLPDSADIAEAVAFLAADRARAITGETINVSAGAFMRY